MNQNLNLFVANLSAPIERLNLDRRILHVLRQARIQTISEIVAAGKHEISLIRNIGPTFTDQIFFAVADYLEVSEEVLASDKIQQIALTVPERSWKSLNTSIIETAQTKAHETEQTNKFWITTDLSTALDSLRLYERAWSVIEYRAVHLSTVEEIGVEIGMSNQKVRQIVRRVNERIQHQLGFLLDYCDFFDEHAKLIRQKITSEELAWSTLIDEFKSQLSGSDLTGTKEDLKRFFAIIRFLVISNKPWVRDTFEIRRKDFTFLVCLMEPPIKKYKPVHQFIKSRTKKTG